MPKPDDSRRDLGWFLATGDLVIGPLIDWLLAKSTRVGLLAAASIFALVVALCCLLMF